MRLRCSELPRMFRLAPILGRRGCVAKIVLDLRAALVQIRGGMYSDGFVIILKGQIILLQTTVRTSAVPESVVIIRLQVDRLGIFVDRITSSTHYSQQVSKIEVDSGIIWREANRDIQVIDSITIIFENAVADSPADICGYIVR